MASSSFYETTYSPVVAGCNNAQFPKQLPMHFLKETKEQNVKSSEQAKQNMYKFKNVPFRPSEVAFSCCVNVARVFEMMLD